MIRRTTVAADADDIAVLAAEARRRGVSLARILGEAVAEKAAQIRGARRPRVGVFAGDGRGIAARMEAEPHAAVQRKLRS